MHQTIHPTPKAPTKCDYCGTKRYRGIAPCVSCAAPCPHCGGGFIRATSAIPGCCSAQQEASLPTPPSYSKSLTRVALTDLRSGLMEWLPSDTPKDFMLPRTCCLIDDKGTLRIRRHDGIVEEGGLTTPPDHQASTATTEHERALETITGILEMNPEAKIRITIQIEPTLPAQFVNVTCVVKGSPE